MRIMDLNKTMRIFIILTAGVLLTAQSLPADEPQTIVIDSVLVTVLEKADVPAREAGLLAKLNIREGDLVRAGQILGGLDDKVPQLERDRVNAELDLAKQRSTNDVRIRFSEKAEAVTRAELKRAQESVDKFSKAISQTEMDRLRLSTEKSTLEVEQARREQREAELETRVKEQELRLADEAVHRRTISAPISGIVVQVSKSPGEWVEPGETVLRILRVDLLRAEGFADARLMQRRQAGQPVTLTIDQPGEKSQTYSGKLVFVSPEVNRFNGQVRVWAEIENPSLTLRPGLTATMTVTSKPHKDNEPPGE
ncbi:Macrolide export protein MacA [Symmachiella dynata]|uniref:Macrolide export protein MacA n=1 Tax=Symmachiella dynata TaxID=2527995 RepID=A0A517ZQV9_9PLAN|nr:HlyD family efflux transporter periplasmic adaptor subunit [Symmachiella dynata]QDU44860.1 Macrolide export protein MacA [Symmachiella dynata]